MAWSTYAFIAVLEATTNEAIPVLDWSTYAFIAVLEATTNEAMPVLAVVIVVCKNVLAFAKAYDVGYVIELADDELPLAYSSVTTR